MHTFLHPLRRGVRIARDRALMRLVPTRPGTIIAAWVVVGIVVALNGVLIVLTLSEA